jgi:prevent-host-death family protein
LEVRRRKVFKTTTVTELRSNLAGYLNQLDDGPVIVLSRSRPTAVLVKPQVFDGLLDRIELLEDLVDGRRAIADFLGNPDSVVDADEVFGRLGV